MASLVRKNLTDFSVVNKKEVMNDKKSTVDMKELWSSLFNPSIYANLAENDSEVLSLLMLLKTAVEYVTQFGSRYETLLTSYKSSLHDLEETRVECSELKENIKSLKNSSCSRCPQLKNQLKEANRRAEEAQTRMNSIAKILALGDDKPGGVDRGSAALVSQVLMSTSESPKRKKRLLRDHQKEEIAEREEEMGMRVEAEEGGAGRNKKVVPETEVDSSNATTLCPTTPLKTKNLVESGAEKGSCSKDNDCCSWKKNMAGCVEYSGRPSVDLSPVKKIDFKLELPKPPEAEPESKEGAPSRLEEDIDIWKAQPSNPPEGDSSRWRLKEKRGSSRDEGRRLRQMTLGVEVAAKKKDLSSVRAADTSEEEVDIVMPSPRKARALKKKRANKNETVDLSLFAPMATSTQITKLNLDNSFDQLPTKKKTSPNYKYKREPVRKKEERLKLQGQKCNECEEYYAGQDLSPGTIQQRLNKCSRHRDQVTRVKSPPGFWDPVMPDTPECQVYTSFRLKDKDK